jgi:hypothetical protein
VLKVTEPVAAMRHIRVQWRLLQQHLEFADELPTRDDIRQIGQALIDAAEGLPAAVVLPIRRGLPAKAA